MDIMNTKLIHTYFNILSYIYIYFIANIAFTAYYDCKINIYYKLDISNTVIFFLKK